MISPFFRRFFPLIALFMRALVRLLAPRYSVSGRHNIPYGGPIIFAANHVSDVDPPVLGAAIRFPVVWMAKRELWEIAWLGKALDFFASFPVDPASSDRSALKVGLTTLENGDALVIFPEGRISKTGEMGPILPGVLLLALKSGVPIVPVGIWGAQKIIPHGETRPRPTLSKVHVHFGPPLHFDDLKDESSRQARFLATQRLQAAMHQAREIARTA